MPQCLTAQTAERFLGFFTVHLCNPHTRRAYARIALQFNDWAAAHGLVSLTEVQLLHVSTYLEHPTLAKQRWLRLFGQPPGVL